MLGTIQPSPAFHFIPNNPFSLWNSPFTWWKENKEHEGDSDSVCDCMRFSPWHHVLLNKYRSKNLISSEGSYVPLSVCKTNKLIKCYRPDTEHKQMEKNANSPLMQALSYKMCYYMMRCRTLVRKSQRARCNNSQYRAMQTKHRHLFWSKRSCNSTSKAFLLYNCVCEWVKEKCCVCRPAHFKQRRNECNMQWFLSQ